jgi:hypothetical protein
MDENNDSKRIEKYAKDIETIKSLLMQVEGKPLIENWAFFTWGFLMLIGSLLHYHTVRFMQLSTAEVFLKVWLPIVLIAIFLETIAWIRKMARESIPLLSRTTIKLWLTVIGTFTGMCFIIAIQVQMNAVSSLPTIILIFFAIMLFAYAQVAYSYLYAHAYFLISVGIIIHLLDLDAQIKFLVAGLSCSLTFITAGVTSLIMEKKNAER